MKKILQHLERAEQITRVVYPLAKDPKVLIDALKELQKITPFLAEKELSKEDKLMLQEIDALLEKHQESPVEFSRDRKFVICSENYALTQVSSEKVNHFINKFKRLHERNL